MNESDTRLKLIDPALKRSWELNQIRTEYYFTDGEIIVRGRMTMRGKPKKADYLLSYAADLPLAIVEAKDTNHSVGAGLQQAMGYAEALDVPFAYSSNGKGFVEHDFFTGKERNLGMEEFPMPGELWERYCTAKGIGDEGMTEFKQIVGRGTRICEPYDKLYFTILDFRDFSRLFADPAFDGEPVQIYEPAPDGPLEPPDDMPDSPPDVTPPPEWPPDDDDEHARIKYYVSGIPVHIVSERVEYYSIGDELVTESLKDYTRRNILGEYDTLDHFKA